MGDLIEQLGINWKLLVSQAVNFFILLAVLRLFVYKPVLEMLRDRKKKIEEGLAKAEEADVRLKEVDEISKNKLKETENKSIELMKETEVKAKAKEQEMIKETEIKRGDLLKKAESAALAKKQEAQDEIYKEAVLLVKRTIAKTVDLDPEKVDDALIKKALSQIE